MQRFLSGCAYFGLLRANFIACHTVIEDEQEAGESLGGAQALRLLGLYGTPLSRLDGDGEDVLVAGHRNGAGERG